MISRAVHDEEFRRHWQHDPEGAANAMEMTFDPADLREIQAPGSMIAHLDDDAVRDILQGSPGSRRMSLAARCARKSSRRVAGAYWCSNTSSKATILSGRASAGMAWAGEAIKPPSFPTTSSSRRTSSRTWSGVPKGKVRWVLMPP